MGLKNDIFEAFENNLKYVNNDGKEVNPLDESKKGKKKVEVLSEDLRDAFLNFLVKQEFRITNMEAPFLIKPGQINTVGSPAAQANVVPVPGFVQISETSNKVGLPTVNTNVKTSKVKLLRVKSGTE